MRILLATQRYLPLYWAKLGCPCSIKSFKHLGIGSSAPANPEQFASNKLATVNVVVVFKTRDD
jgi:hypothetical protein